MSQLSMFSNSPVKASNILGLKVVNPKGEHLGEMKELVIDPTLGRVAYAVVSFVQSFVLGEKLFAIPFSSLRLNVTKNEYVLDVPKAKFEKASGFDADKWPSMADESWHRELSRFYNRPPYWE